MRDICASTRSIVPLGSFALGDLPGNASLVALVIFNKGLRQFERHSRVMHWAPVKNRTQ